MKFKGRWVWNCTRPITISTGPKQGTSLGPYTRLYYPRYPSSVYALKLGFLSPTLLFVQEVSVFIRLLNCWSTIGYCRSKVTLVELSYLFCQCSVCSSANFCSGFVDLHSVSQALLNLQWCGLWSKVHKGNADSKSAAARQPLRWIHRWLPSI